MKITCASIGWALWLVSVAASAQTVFDVATSRALPDGAPPASAVIMRSLRIHPAKADDPHDTLQALRDFHVSRLEWAYITEPEFIRQVKESGRLFGGAVSAPSYIPPEGAKDWFENVVIVNLNGEPIFAPWKRSWNRTLWGCINNPELERGYSAELRKYVDAGAQVMQRDEPGGNVHAVTWGGCFCEHCVTGFRQWLTEHRTPEELAGMGIERVAEFDYRAHLRAQGAPVGDAFAKWDGGELKQAFAAFQTEATVAFHKRTREAADAHAGRRLPMSCNNGVRRWTAVELQFDWVFGELSYGDARPSHIVEVMRTATAQNSLQVVTMPKASDWEQRADLVLRTRRTIAMAYACGGHCMVPWDTYMPGNAPRYFGAPADYADLYGFVRASAAWLDGYEEAAVTGPGVEESRYGDTPPAEFSGNAPVYAVVRAVPERPDLPVAIHVVDWSDAPAPTTLRLNLPALGITGEPKALLLAPAPYAEETHAATESAGEYEPLAVQTPLIPDSEGRCTLPPMTPWGIVLIQPAA